MADKVAEALYKGTRREGFGRNRGHIGAFGEFTEGVLTDKANLVAQALMAPRNALQGQYNELEVSPSGAVSQMDPRLMQDAATLAGTISLGSAGMPTPMNSLAMGSARRIASDPVPEGFPIQPGQPFPFMHNTEGAFNHVPKGSAAYEAFGMHLDPKGRFIIHDEGGAGRAPDERWVKGEAQFSNPLIINESGWKERVSKAYGGATGAKLTALLKKDGYDGIVTFDKYGTSEIVDLR